MALRGLRLSLAVVFARNDDGRITAPFSGPYARKFGSDGKILAEEPPTCVYGRENSAGGLPV